MKNLSDLINENENNKMFKYVVDVKIEGTVKAGSEGDAGELVDKEIDAMDGVVDYKIVSIDETEKDVNENSDAALLSEEESIIDLAYDEIVELYNNYVEQLSMTYNKMHLKNKLQDFFNN